MKLNKIKIEKMANDIMKFLKENELDSDVCIYFNDKRMVSNGIEDGKFNPRDYFEYAAEKHILSMSFEGPFYDVINRMEGALYNKFEKILKKYGVYEELGDSWNCTMYVIDEGSEVEYVYYSNNPKPIYVNHLRQKDVPVEINLIAAQWVIYQEKIGDRGSCVLGAGFEFEYQGNLYFLTPCSRFQGNLSWETNKDEIRLLLKEAGATKIRYDWGFMD